VPAVLAMQFEISDDAACEFSEVFYTSLASGNPIESALGAARSALLNDRNFTEWATPVLFMRSTDGRLFDFNRQPSSAILLELTDDEVARRHALTVSQSESGEEPSTRVDPALDRPSAIHLDRAAPIAELTSVSAFIGSCVAIANATWAYAYIFTDRPVVKIVGISLIVLGLALFFRRLLIARRTENGFDDVWLGVGCSILGAFSLVFPFGPKAPLAVMDIQLAAIAFRPIAAALLGRENRFALQEPLPHYLLLAQYVATIFYLSALISGPFERTLLPGLLVYSCVPLGIAAAIPFLRRRSLAMYLATSSALPSICVPAMYSFYSALTSLGGYAFIIAAIFMIYSLISSFLYLSASYLPAGIYAHSRSSALKQTLKYLNAAVFVSAWLLFVIDQLTGGNTAAFRP
jgi:hypothetical protein